MRGSPPSPLRRHVVAPGGAIATERTEGAAPGPREVWIEVRAAELGSPELRALDTAAAAGRSLVPGGAAAGVVVCAGEGVEDLVDARVLVPGLLPCGECPVCRRGWVTACPRALRPGVDADGAWASHVRVPGTFLCRLDGPLDAGDGWEALALVAGPAARAYQALSRAGVGPGELLVVVGAGPEATFAIELGRARGALPVVVSPRALHDRDALAVEAARLEAALPWRVLETTGRPEHAAAAARLASPGGTVSFLAPPDEAALPLAELARHEVSVQASSACHPDLLPELVALALRGELGAHRSARTVDASDLAGAIAALREGREAAPVLVRP